MIPKRLYTEADFAAAPLGTKVEWFWSAQKFWKKEGFYWKSTNGFIETPKGLADSTGRRVLRWGDGESLDEWAEDLVLNEI